MQQELQTELLIESAPCISFRTLLHSSEKRNSKLRRGKTKRDYTQACIKASKRQLSMGRYLLHEHPVHASSWCMPEMRDFLNDGRIHLVQVIGAWLRQTIEMNRDSCAEKRAGQRAARGWQRCWRENMLERIVECG